MSARPVHPILCTMQAIMHAPNVGLDKLSSWMMWTSMPACAPRPNITMECDVYPATCLSTGMKPPSDVRDVQLAWYTASKPTDAQSAPKVPPSKSTTDAIHAPTIPTTIMTIIPAYPAGSTHSTIPSPASANVWMDITTMLPPRHALVVPLISFTTRPPTNAKAVGLTKCYTRASATTAPTIPTMMQASTPAWNAMQAMSSIKWIKPASANVLEEQFTSMRQESASAPKIRSTGMAPCAYLVPYPDTGMQSNQLVCNAPPANSSMLVSRSAIPASQAMLSIHQPIPALVCA